jgi:hypothetical protein
MVGNVLLVGDGKRRSLGLSDFLGTWRLELMIFLNRQVSRGSRNSCFVKLVSCL